MNWRVKNSVTLNEMARGWRLTAAVSQYPESIGSIHAKSPGEVDQQCIVRSMQLARRIVGQPAMAQFIEHEMSPGPQVIADADWLAFACENGQTIYHPLGTCRMGDDDGAVVNSRLRLRGLSGLRIVDVSVMQYPGAVMMVAEKGAGLILEDQQR